MAEGGATIELTGKVEPAAGGYCARIIISCAGLHVEEVGLTYATPEAAQEQLEDALTDIALRVQPPPEGLHA
jgi:hypothetical protein